IAGHVIIDAIGLQIGYSLGKAIRRGASFGDCAEATVDLWVTIKKDDGAGDAFRSLRSLGGQTPGVAVEGIGWRQGSVSFPATFAPDGVVIMIANLIGIVFEEVSVVAEQGASYFCVSAG